MNRTMWELIKVIEDAGIHVRSAKWQKGTHLNIDVESKHHEEAGALIQEYWRKEQAERISLITVPWKEDEEEIKNNVILDESLINMFEADNTGKFLYESTVIERLIISHRALFAANAALQNELTAAKAESDMWRMRLQKEANR